VSAVLLVLSIIWNVVLAVEAVVIGRLVYWQRKLIDALSVDREDR
jgi:hypothetical protein